MTDGRWCIRGDPWNELAVRNSQPLGMGTLDVSWCPIDESGTKIFACGGRMSCKSTSREWVQARGGYNSATSRCNKAGILDIETGLWEELPDMPITPHEASICRLGTKIYVICGFGGHVLCFDIAQRKWVPSGCPNAPDPLISDMFASKLNEDTIILTPGGKTKSIQMEIVGDGGGLQTLGPSQLVLTLNVSSGQWTRLPNLPESMCATERSCQGLLVDSNYVFIRREKWARLLLNGTWDVMPDLSGKGVNALSIHGYDIKIFTGKRWRKLDSQSQYNEIINHGLPYGSTLLRI